MKRKIEGYHRAKTMLPEIRELIVEAAISTSIKREALADGLLIRIEKNYPKEIPPKIETIIKEISKARNHSTNPLDEPWHLGILNKLHDYGIPPISGDGIDAILKVQRWLSETSGKAWVDVNMKKKEFTKIGFGAFTLLFHTLSIRQAKWIAALYRTTGNDPRYLWLVSFYYTYHEIISNLSGTTFNTQSIDSFLCYGKKSFVSMLDYKMLAELDIYGETLTKAMDIIGNTGKQKGEQK